MKIYRATLETCQTATGLVVAIDVLRAFTTSAFAFAAGADEIILVSKVAEAFELKKQFPNALLMGEVDGIQVDGFDLGNSPSALIDLDLAGRQIIHRSSAGTQGVTRAVNAEPILTSSLCCVSATVRYIKQIAPDTVTLIETGVFPGGWGDEDTACADLIEKMLTGKPYQLDKILDRVKHSRSGSHYQEADHPTFPQKDLECAMEIDKFDFAMVVYRRDGQMVLKAIDTA